MRIFQTFFLVACVSAAMAQTFRQKTNDIRLNFKDGQADTSIPTIQWITPQPEFTHSQRNDLTIEANVSSDIPLTSISLTLVDAEKNETVKKFDVAGTGTQAIKQTLTLPDGQHTMKITVVNNKGGQVSSMRSILIGKDAIADAVSIDRKDYAILFATDKYDHWSDLVNPVEDANSIALELKEKYGFETEVIENPSQEDVFIKIAEYVQRQYKPQDQLLIFFAGHGYFDDTFGEGFVVAKNSLENDKAKTSYISHSRLRSVLNNIPCEHIFLTMDVCFGGTFDPVIAKERGDTYEEASSQELLVRKLSYKTRKYLTSGGKTYVSDGVAGKHSPFALKLLQALKDSGGSDRILTINEIKAYVERLNPEPRFGSFGEDNPASDFVFVAR
jgi:hypothetical protein